MPPDAIDYVVVGRLRADYYITPEGNAITNQPGGSALYGVVGAAVWTPSIGLVARTGDNYNRSWLETLAQNGIETAGVRATGAPQEHRDFFAYATSGGDVTRADPATHFARIGQPLPEDLKDFDEHRPPDPPDTFGPLAVRPDDLPEHYLRAQALHIAPCEFITHRTMPAAARSVGTKVLTCDPAARYMQPSFQTELRLIMAGLDAFLPNESKVRNYFRSEIDDLWEAAEALGAMGAAIVVIKRGSKGQYVLERASGSRWHVPAYPVNVVDVTGAGDAYSGGFLIGLAKTGDAVEAAVRGSISASLVLEGHNPLHALGAHPRLAEARLNAQRELVRRL